MFDHVKNLLHRQGSCVKFLSRCHPDVETRLGKDDDYSSTAMSVVWLECITARLSTFWALSEREFLVSAMAKLNPSGEFHVRWLSQLLLSCYPALEIHFEEAKKAQKETQGSSKQISPVGGGYSARNRPIGDLRGKGRRNSMMQLEKEWKSIPVVKKSQPLTPAGSEVAAATAPQNELSTATATTPTSVMKLRLDKQAQEEKRMKKKNKFSQLNQKRLEGILPHIYAEAKEVLKNCAFVLKTNDITLEEVERELELHFPHGDLIDISMMKHAIKLFGRNYSTTGEMLHLSKYLQHVVDTVPEGLLEHQKDSESGSRGGGGGRSAVAVKKRYPLWRDMLLVVTHYYDSR